MRKSLTIEWGTRDPQHNLPAQFAYGVTRWADREMAENAARTRGHEVVIRWVSDWECPNGRTEAEDEYPDVSGGGVPYSAQTERSEDDEKEAR